MPSNVPTLDADSYKPLLVEVVFQSLPGRPTIPLVGPFAVSRATQRQTLPLQLDFFESLTLTMTEKSAPTGQLTLFDRTGDTLLSILAAAGRNRRLLLRWGWDDGRGIEVYPQFVMDYSEFNPEFTAEGTRIAFELMAAAAYEQALDKRAGADRSFDANTKISDVVRAIAEDRKWKFKKSVGGGRMVSTIEDTTSVLTEPLVIRAGESDFAFIRERLLPRAENAQGRGNYKFFFDDANFVHFRSSGSTRDFVKAYTFAQSMMGEVVSFSPKDALFESSLFGGHNTIFWAIDSLTGQRLRIPSLGPRGLPDRTEVSEESTAFLTRLVPPGEEEKQVQMYAAMVARTEADFRQKVRARFDTLRDQPYAAELAVLGTHVALPLDNLKVNFLTSQDQAPHFLSGIYRIFGIEHSVSSGGWQTQFTLQRGGVQQTKGSLKKEGQKTKQEPAPGAEDGEVRNPQASADQKPGPRIERQAQSG